MPVSTKTHEDTIEQSKSHSQPKEPSKYKVILFNDDKTTFQFVIDILRIVFHKSFDEAVGITEQIHHQGSGIAGIYSQEIAEEKTNEVINLARQNSFPLSATFEEY